MSQAKVEHVIESPTVVNTVYVVKRTTVGSGLVSTVKLSTPIECRLGNGESAWNNYETWYMDESDDFYLYAETEEEALQCHAFGIDHLLTLSKVW